jgi:hypothetical protein
MTRGSAFGIGNEAPGPCTADDTARDDVAAAAAAAVVAADVQECPDRRDEDERRQSVSPFAGFAVGRVPLVAMTTVGVDDDELGRGLSPHVVATDSGFVWRTCGGGGDPAIPT